MSGESGDRRDNHQPERGHTVKVRTTINPGTVIEVGDAELVDLDRQHLIDSREGDEGWVDAEPTEVESGVITDELPAELETKRAAAAAAEVKSTDKGGPDGFATLSSTKDGPK